MKLHKYMMLLSVPLVLAACGGGGDDGSDRPVTKAPVANAGADQVVPMGTNVVLDGSASEAGTNGSGLSYRWTMNAKPAGSGATFADATVVAPSFTADFPGQYVIDLVVNDGATNSQPDSVTVRATTTVPVAIVDVLQNVVLGETVTLDGSQSVPPEGGNAAALVYRWSLTSRPDGSAAELLNATTAKPVFQADKAGEYRAQLIVRYGDQDSAPREVSVQALATNRAPVAVPTVISVNGQPAVPVRPGSNNYKVERGQQIKLDGSDSTDADGDVLSHRWSVVLSGYGDNFVGSKIVSRSQNGVAMPYGKELTFAPDVVGTWQATLSVFDGVEYSSAAVTFTVVKPADAPNTPPVAAIASTTGTNEIEVGEAVTLTPSPSYDIDGDNLYGKFRWRFVEYPADFTPPSVPATSFSGLYFTPSVRGAYTVEVIANDGQADSQPVQATFTAMRGANRVPVGSMSLDKKTVLVGEDLVYTCGGSDPDGDELNCTFTLSQAPEGSQAQLRVSGNSVSIKTDKPGVYAVDARVFDSKGAERDSRYFPVNALGRAKTTNSAPLVGEANLVFNSASEGFSGRYLERKPFSGNSVSFSLGSDTQPLLSGGVLNLGVSVVDPDGDDLYYLTTLNQQPSGSKLAEAFDSATYQATPVVPGKYVVGFIANDGIVSTSSKDVTFHVVDRQNYPGLLLETAGTKTDNWSDRLYGQAAFPYVQNQYVSNISYAMMGGAVYGQTYRLTAFDRDYTITDLQASSVDAGYLPWFTGLANNQVVKKGESVEFMIFRPFVPGESAFQAVDGAQVAAYDFAWSFRVAEKAGWTFDVKN